MFKWDFIKLDEICTFQKGKTGLAKAVEGKYTLVATGKNRKTCNTFQFDTKAVCIPLVSSTGHGHASLKYVHYQEGKFALGTILVAVIPKDENIINAQFLHLYLSRLKDTVLVPLMTGAANVTLTVTKLKQVKVPLPPIEEQLKIVSLFNRMDNEQLALTDEITHQQTLVKKLRQSILQEAIEGKLTASWRKENPNVESASILLEKIKAEKEELIKAKKIKKQKPLAPIEKDEIPFEIPDGWVWCRLGTIFNTTSGGTPTRGNPTYWNGDISWLKSGEMTDAVIVKESEEKITEVGLNKSSATLFPEETILIAMYGATAGRLGILTFPSSTNQAVCGFYKNTFILKEYLFYFLKTQRDKILEDSWGQSQPNISQTYLKGILFSLPPLKEQKQIVKKIESLFKICDEIETHINTSKENAQSLMQSVLKEAFENK